ncbi:hypothetical protein HETIRDRAFT_452672 [Heterobasidion irregulare TC 32-1]|uniref:Uncharacterized protein n=1 Tax=Heterobasidion irregulare (strain TC 32-1) TaxID=747525 RepID=W4K126_HETIT|nr:uncharacterized protein HETIRDRAFT_452672 [Heterobasidion irregulare TC 32-1]ETW79517.1 hypothetical protein HETIRDRAFT_452672 [Heterobasidion irregulare TC 32-1]
MVKMRRDWNWSYDQSESLSTPTLKTIDSFDARRVAVDKSLNGPSDIMSLYNEEDIFEYRLVPVTNKFASIFRFDRDDDPVPPTTLDADHSSSNPNLSRLPTPDIDHTAPESDSDPVPPNIIGHIVSDSNSLPPATSEVDHSAPNSDVATSDVGLSEPQPHLSAQTTALFLMQTPQHQTQIIHSQMPVPKLT